MNNLKTTLAQSRILAAAFFTSLVETLLIVVGIVFAGALALVIVPVFNWIANAVLAKAKMKMVKR